MAKNPLGDTVRYYTSSVNADVDGFNRLVLRALVKDDSTGELQSVEVFIDPAGIPATIRTVANLGARALEQIADAWAQGDCPTCQNLRLVDVVKPNGVKTNTYCPDCNPDRSTTGTGLVDFPRIGNRTAADVNEM